MSTYGVSLLASLLLIASSVLPVVYRFFTDNRGPGHRIRVELANPAPEGPDAARDVAPSGRRE